MSESSEFSITVQQESDYVFRIQFDDTTIPPLLTDEMPPVGTGAGPNPSRTLVAAVANCLSASLLFAMRKFKNQPGPLTTRATATIERNEHGRLRVKHIRADMQLPEKADQYEHLERLLEQFENFCVVTESVRDGIEVAVNVRDADGTLLHQSQA